MNEQQEQESNEDNNNSIKTNPTAPKPTSICPTDPKATRYPNALDLLSPGMSLPSTWKMVGSPNPSPKPSRTRARTSSLGKRVRAGVASVDKDQRKTVKLKTRFPPCVFDLLNRLNETNFQNNVKQRR